MFYKQADYYVVAVEVDSCDQFIIRSFHGLSLFLCCLLTTTF
jgi:hypothetical protein